MEMPLKSSEPGRVHRRAPSPQLSPELRTADALVALVSARVWVGSEPPGMQPAAAALCVDQSAVITWERCKAPFFFSCSDIGNNTAVIDGEGPMDLLSHSKQMSCEIPSS